MRTHFLLGLSLGLALALASPARADVWDLNFDHDNAPSTDNTLLHGTVQTHDMLPIQGGSTADRDWYLMHVPDYSSWEVLIDSASGDLNLTGDVTLHNSQGQEPPLKTAVPANSYAQSLRFSRESENDTGYLPMLVRVGPGQTCGTDCGTEDTYRIRAYETSYSIPRFNNGSGQVTVLVLQNPTDYAIAGKAYFWSTGGSLLGSHVFSLAAKAAMVTNTGTLAGLAGQSGTITITNDGRYGDLSGKTVALDPATGFSFDSPMIPRVD